MVKKFLSVIMLCCLIIVGTGTMATAFADETTEIEPNQSYLQTDSTEIEPYSVDVLSAPVCAIYSGQQFSANDKIFYPNDMRFNGAIYNCAVMYSWSASNGNLQLKYGLNDTYKDMGSNTYTEYAFPRYTVASQDMNDPYDDFASRCEPNYKFGRSISGTTVSSEMNIGWDQYNKAKEYYIERYSYNCKYACVGYLVKTHITEQNVPTKYDQDLFVWEHNGSKKQIIKATIKYKDQISNIEVEIPPMLKLNTSKVTLNGVTFYLRSGYKKCSIKTDEDNIKAADLHFAFGVA